MIEAASSPDELVPAFSFGAVAVLELDSLWQPVSKSIDRLIEVKRGSNAKIDLWV
jgi:hypothetical protein